jgi:hypothetical protein
MTTGAQNSPQPLHREHQSILGILCYMFRSYDHRFSELDNLLSPHEIPGPYRDEV